MVVGLIALSLAGLFLRIWSKIIPETSEKMHERALSTIVESIEGVPIRIDSQSETDYTALVTDFLGADYVGTRSYWYEFENGFRVPVTAQLYEAMIESHPLRVYHKRGSETFLSIEVLPFSWSPRQASRVDSVIAQKSWHE